MLTKVFTMATNTFIIKQLYKYIQKLNGNATEMLSMDMLHFHFPFHSAFYYHIILHSLRFEIVHAQFDVHPQNLLLSFGLNY